MDQVATTNRPLTPGERCLMHWMLEHGTLEAKLFFGQLEVASATSWKCPCGCASINLAIDGMQPPTGGMTILADFVFGDGDAYGIFMYHQNGTLSGLEVCGYADDAPKVLPEPNALRAIP